MNVEFKKLGMLFLVLAFLPFAFMGCQKKANVGLCKHDSDCRMDANGKEINGVCHMGKCEECAQDTDCSDLKQCVNNRCLSACQADSDCAPNNHCENNFCTPDCVNNDSCPGSHICAQGRCVSEVNSNDPNAWAGGECGSLEIVYFDFDQYNIKAEQRDYVAKLARCLESNPSYRVTIQGHTDVRGTPSYNLMLGQKRADAVKNHLATLGIASNRVETVSLGDQQPAVNERTEYAWQQNRRANFILAK